MGKTLRVLNVEDSIPDADLIKHHLAGAGYQLIFERVETAEAMREALTAKVWDVVLSDYIIPGFSALMALDVLLESGLDIPFIVVSGTVSEEVAVQAMRAGANDYLPKDNLTRLIPVIKREMNESVNRTRLRKTEEDRRLSDERYRTLFEYAPDGIIVSSPDEYYLDANASMCRMLGYTHQELVGMHASNIVIPSEVKHLTPTIESIGPESEHNRVWHFLRRDGTVFLGEVQITQMPDGNLLAMIRDITERRVAEERLNRSQANLATAQRIAHIGSWEMDLPLAANGNTSPLRWSDEVFHIFGYKPGEIEVSNDNFFRAVHPDDRENIRAGVGRALREGSTYDLDHRIIRPDGSERIVHEHAEIISDERTGTFLKMVGTIQDITARKLIEKELFETAKSKTESLALIDTILASAPFGFAFHDSDLGYVRINDALAKMNGVPAEQHLGHTLAETLPEMAPIIEPLLRDVLKTGEPVTDVDLTVENRANPGEEHFWLASLYPVRTFEGEMLGVGVLVSDITARKRLENERRIISEIIQSAATTPNLDEFLKSVHRSISEVVYAENCFVMLHDPVTGTDHFEFWVDKYDPQPAPESAGRGFANYVFRSAEPLLLTEESQKRIIDTGEGEQIGSFSPSWLGVPLRTPDSTIGVLVLQHYEDEGSYDQHDLEFLSSVADPVALAIERKRAEEALGESEERYRELIENATDIMYTFDFEGTFTSINKVAEAITGYTKEESRSMNTVQIVAPEYRAIAAHYILERLAGKDVSAYEIEIVTKAGNRVAVEVNTRIIYEKGVPVGVQGIARDITDRKKAEAALLRSEERYRELVENALDIIYAHDLQGNYTSVNKAGETITGYTVEESMQMNLIDTIAPEFVEKARQMIAAKLAGEATTAYELELIAKDGHRVPLEVNTRIIHENGVPVGIQGIARDITERKSAEARLRRLVDSNVQGVFFWNINGEISGGNDAFLTLAGYTREDLDAGLINWITLTPPEYAHLDARALDELAAVGTCTAYEKEWVRKDGSRVPVLLGAAMLEESPDDGVCFVLDITERVLAATALEDSEASFRSLFNTANDAILVMSEGIFLDCNSKAEMVFGCEKKDLVNCSPLAFSPNEQPDGRLSSEKAVEYLAGAANGEPQFFEWKHIRLDGTPFDAEVSLNRVQFRGEMRIQALVRDITDRKRKDAELRESQGRVEDIVNSIDGIVWEADAETFRFTFVSKQAERILGYPAHRWLDEPTFWADHIHPDDRDAAVRFCTNSTSNLEPHQFEYRMLAQDGREVWIKDTVTVLVEEGRPVKLRGLIMDITERRLADQALSESNEKFRQLADNITDAFWIRSADMTKVLYVSPAFEQIWGRTLTKHYGEPMEWLDRIVPDDRQRVGDAYAGLMDNARNIEVEYRIQRPDGEVRWVRTRGFQIRDDAGTLIRLAGIVTDITEKKNVEDALQRQQTELRVLFDLVPAMFWFKDTENRILRVNKRVADAAGKSREEIEGQLTVEVYPNEAAQHYSDDLEVIRSGAPKLGVIEKLPDGADGEVWLQTDKVPVFDDEGEPIGIVVMAQDISERKRAEAALGESEERYRELVENAIDIIYTLDVNGNYTSVNKACENITGYLREQSLTRNMAESLAPEYREKGAQILAAHLAGINLPAYELELVARDGHRISIEVNTRPIVEDGVAVGVQGIARDITDRKRTEAALTESELRYHSLFENMLEGYAYCETVFDGDELQDFIYLEVNGAFETLTGLKDVVGKKVSEVIPGVRHSSPELFAIYGRVSLTGNPERFETYLPPLDIWLSVTVYSSERTQFVAVFDNITLRKHAEALLTESRLSLKLAAESANLGIWDWDVVANRLVWDNRMYELYGISEETFSGAYEAWTAGLHPGDRERADAEIKAALDGTKPFDTDFRVVWPNGEVRHIEARALLKRAADGSPLRMVGVNWDITERKQLEDQFRQAQKMEAVGVLAGGIAHDFNNLLTAINGYSDLTLKKMAPDDPLRHNIEEVKTAGSRAAELTGQLLAFSRKQVLKSVVLNLNTVVSDFKTMLRRIIKENIDLRFVLDPALGNIMGDPGQIEQVIMNLAINARDAMPDGGTLTIETQNVYLADEYLSHHIAVEPGDFVKMTVTDTGSGMDAVTQSHIFEPFFTTKDVDKGTGLGLSTVYGIVKQSGGDVLVYSEIGHGTAFKIYLPCVDEAVQKPRWVAEREQKYSGTETILVVEDEDIVRNLVREVLTDSGYKVLEAASGRAALSICNDYAGPIHMLLTDVIMPKMGGVELNDRVVKLLPDIKVLFMSGYTDDAIAGRGVSDSEIQFIEKPFTPDGLARKVRAVLAY